MIHIIGAGLAGLLAGNMLRNRAQVYEKQASLPNNHHALLRFKTGVFGTALGIPFKKVQMIKAVWGDNSSPIKDNIRYSMKVTGGQIRSDRSLPIGVVKEERFIAPPNLIGQMSDNCSISYDVDFVSKWNTNAKFDYYEPLISTIPMPDLMELLKYPNIPKFKSLEGEVVSADIEDCDAYVTLYYPSEDIGPYRASITGNKLIIEYAGEFDFAFTSTARFIVGTTFGIDPDRIQNLQSKHMKYAKILPIDDRIRKDFMHWATDKYNIYSLGRFATWRPSLLLDDLVQDVNLISQWITEGRYNAAKHR